MIQTTAWKVSVFGVFLVRIFSHLDWKRTRKTPNTNTFHAVDLFKNSELLLLLSREKLLHPPAELFCYYKNVKKTCINHLLIYFYWDLIEIYESFLLEYKSCKSILWRFSNCSSKVFSNGESNKLTEMKKNDVKRRCVSYSWLI